MVVDKPAGLTTFVAADGPRGGKATAFDHVLAMLKQRHGPRQVLFPIQTLDRDVSGVLVFARNENTAIKLGEAFRTRRATRTYAALVCGTPPAGSGADAIGTVQTMLAPNRRGVADVLPIGAEFEHAAPGDAETAHVRAVTHYRVRRAGPALTLLRVRAETDYPYQVRAHLAHVGCPVAGDKAYGAGHDPLGRVALHLSEVSFIDPWTSREMRYSVRPPASFAEAVAYEPSMARTAAAAGTSWENVAEWYGALVSEGRSDLHDAIVWPGTLRLLGLRAGERLLDVACGPGDLAGHALQAGAEYVGVDASPRLIEIAASRFADAAFRVGDAAALGDTAGVEPGTFDAAACVLALMNIEDIDGAAGSIAAALRPGGRAVLVLLHPVLRSPKLTGWGWTSGVNIKQYRRVDGYLGEASLPIVMNPGGAAGGAEEVTTTTFHRPLSRYVAALSSAGLLIDALEEWASHRKSQPGPRAAAENKAREEIPMFMALRVRRGE